MATRRDQLHSYQFLTQRVISAFVMRETDPQQSPLRRGIGAVFAGVMVAILIAAGFGIYGIITNVGGDKWKTDGAVVIEKETGATFVFSGGVLHPTLNYASAMLITGRPGPRVFRVGGAALDETPRGVPVGIPGAPTSLPPAKRRVGLPWTVCATPDADGAGGAASRVTLAVAAAPSGGRRLGEEGVLVADAELELTYLVWHGRRHLVQSPRTVVPALFGAVSAAPVGTAWLNALPAGADIARISVDGRGRPSPSLPDRVIGEILATETGSGTQFWLVLPDGAAPITPLQQAVLNAEFPAEPTPVPVATVTNGPISARRLPAGDTQPPESPPPLVAPAGGDGLCAVTGDPAAPPAVWTGGTVPGLAAAIPTPGASPDGVPLADGVLVPSGRVATVRAKASPTAPSGPYYVVTDLGLRHSVPTPAVLESLGYPPEQVVDVPATLIGLLPAGPTLDPAAAARPAGS